MSKPVRSNARGGSVAQSEESRQMCLWNYPVDMSLFLSEAQINHAVGIAPGRTGAQSDSPGVVTLYALTLWNRYYTDQEEYLRAAFLAQARWLVDHQQSICQGSGSWLLTFAPESPYAGKRYLSSVVQGQALSVLTRAYMLTRDTVYLEVAGRALCVFERDILDGGICSPLPGDGIFFEECAVYPAAHSLRGMVFAMLGLVDYCRIADKSDVAVLLHKSHETLHRFLPEFDTGYWIRPDLMHHELARKAQLAQQICLLHALAEGTQCEQCAVLVARWRRNQQRLMIPPRVHLQRCFSSLAGTCKLLLRPLLFPRRPAAHSHEQAFLTRNKLHGVCVPITAFPVMGGMRTVVASIARVTSDIWRLEYLTQYVGPNPARLPIHRFGGTASAPWQFPSVWLYVLAGARKLVALLRRDGNIRLILPQDGVYTAAYSALVGRLAGIRVVCMDYGNLTLLQNPTFIHERYKTLATKNWVARRIGLLRFKCYWPSLAFCTWLSTRLADHFLIAGMEGDGIEDVYCEQMGVPRSRITRYAYMIDLARHPVFDAQEKSQKRRQNNIAADALVITMICRLSPEKGVDVALESISQALAALSPEQRAHALFVLAGDGPLREQIKAEISARGLGGVCKMWGEASPEEVVMLLGLCDVFLHTSTRGAYYSMNILEAMASGCAIIASNEPPLNTQLLVAGRGIVVPAGDAKQTALALEHVLTNPREGYEMGELARKYIAERHSPEMLKRVLLRATSWSELDSLPGFGHEAEQREVTTC